MGWKERGRVRKAPSLQQPREMLHLLSGSSSCSSFSHHIFHKLPGKSFPQHPVAKSRSKKSSGYLARAVLFVSSPADFLRYKFNEMKRFGYIMVLRIHTLKEEWIVKRREWFCGRAVPDPSLRSLCFSQLTLCKPQMCYLDLIRQNSFPFPS